MMASPSETPRRPDGPDRRSAGSLPRSPDRVRRVAGAGAALLLALVATAGLPAAASAQDGSAPPGRADDRPAATRDDRIEATAFVGVLAPLSRLTADPETFETEVSSSALFGGEVSWWPRRRIGLAAQGAWAPAELSLIPTDFTGALPDDLGDAAYWAASLEARYRLPVPPEVDLVRPYVAAGGGLRRLDVQPIASPEVTDATDPMATAAAGARVRVGADAALRFELRDRVTRFESPTGGDDRWQNDLAVTVGLGVGLP